MLTAEETFGSDAFLKNEVWRCFVPRDMMPAKHDKRIVTNDNSDRQEIDGKRSTILIRHIRQMAIVDSNLKQDLG